MSFRVAVAITIAAFLPVSRSLGQLVVIHHTTTPAITELFKADLPPQGFHFVSADKKGMLFNVDRGLVPQQGGAGMVHVFLELRFQFKPMADSCEVTAGEEVVAEGFASNRKEVTSQRAALQDFLEKEKVTLESRPAADSTAKHDSTGH